MKKAVKSDWQTIDMPHKNKSFKVDIQLTKEEFDVLQNGNIPQEMEDKWFIYFAEDKLYMHRSWTGTCIYIVKFLPDYKVDFVIVNRNKEEYLETNIKRDKIMVNMLIDNLVNRPYNQKLRDEYAELYLKKNILQKLRDKFR